jgi:hypothetical protein
MYVNFLFHLIGDHDDDVNVLSRSVHTIKKNTDALAVANKETGLEENVDKAEYMVMSRNKMQNEIMI